MYTLTYGNGAVPVSGDYGTGAGAHTDLTGTQSIYSITYVQTGVFTGSLTVSNPYS